MVLAQKQIRSPEKQNKRPRYESIQLHPAEFSQRCQKQVKEKNQSLQQILLGKLNIYIQKTESRFMSFILYKYQLKVD
jgi:hypothetical protein